MKKLYLAFSVLFLQTVILHGQDIKSNSPVTLPATGSYSVASGQTANIVSSRSISLQPGTTLSAGSTVYIGVNKNLVAPAPSNGDNDVLRNWIFTRSYDDDGNETGAKKDFFDNSGKPIQTQVKSESMGHVLASQPLYDIHGRAIGATLSAPINNAEFAFKDNFITNTSGTNYNYKNFDGDQTYGLNSKTNNPDPVGSSTIGTLGWYYSDNNTIEPMVPSTSYPYSRNDMTRDGTAVSRYSAGIGEVLKMGTGHETSNNSFPVVNELAAYMQIRNKLNSVVPLGTLPASLAGNSLQIVGQDKNGTQIMRITDLSGNTLMAARAVPVTETPWLTVNNTITLNQPTNLFKSRVTFGSVAGWLNQDNIVGLTVLSSNTIKISKNGVALPPSTYSVIESSSNDNAVFDIESSQPFYYFYTKTNSRDGVRTDNSTVGNFPAVKDDPATTTVQYFYLTAPSAVTVTGLCSLYEMKTETKLYSFSSGQTLPAGYYKAVTTNDPSNPTATPATVTYTNKYADIAYLFYNQAGQLIADISPAGVQAYLNNPGSFTTGFDIPYTNKYEYDTRGRNIAKTFPDVGKSEYLYSTDGHLRFSQNASQKIIVSGNEKFSYTNYDDKGRPVETGEYVVPVAGGFTFSSAKTNTLLLDNTSPGGGLTGGVKQDQQNTYYDFPATNLSLSGYTQDESFLHGTVSYTQNAASTTWYNYDSQGRIAWVVKKLTDMPANAFKTIDYTYNARGNTTKIDYQRLTASERFIHYYDYDGDSRLINVQTSVDDINKVQQASYGYYLQGPLKRVELADDLQGLDYTYTAQGWVKSMNSPTAVPANDAGKDGDTGSLFAPDAFGMQMEYFPGDYTRTGSNINSVTPTQRTYFDGNVNGISWQTKPSTSGSATSSMYTYKYDGKYQLTDAIWGSPSTGSTPTFTPDVANKFKEYGISYDANGNIKSLLRTNSTGVLTENYGNYQYQAGTNKLLGVGTTTTPGSYATYTYDEIGRLKSQTQGSSTIYFKYNVSGQITGIYTNPAFSGIPLVSYVYDEYGNRIKSVSPTLTTFYVYDAAGTVVAIYTGTNGSTLAEVPVYGSQRLGVYIASSSNFRYEIRDNVGSVRAVIKRVKVSGQPDIYGYSDYYPYGTRAQGMNSDYRYQYQGLFAEKDQVTGYTNFDLRMYDSKIGRWLSVDPANQYPSPYEGMANNPVVNIDPDGDCSPCNPVPPGAPDNPADGQEYNDGKNNFIFNDEGNGWAHSLAEVSINPNGIFAYGPNAGFNDNGYAASLYGFGFAKDWKYGSSSMLIEGPGAEIHYITDKSGISMGASAFFLQGTLKGRLKYGDAAATGEASGSLLKADADFGIKLPTLDEMEIKAGGEAGAWVAKGELKGGLDLGGGFKISTKVSATGLSAHIGAHASMKYDRDQSVWIIDVDENIGLLIGEGAGIHLEVPGIFERFLK